MANTAKQAEFRLQRRPTHETQQSSGVVQQCVGAMVTTNERLTASLAKLTLPKCQPDVFSGDATMFHPWKSAFKGMIHGCNVTPENEMNYLCTYTTGDPRKLVDSYRKRRHKNPQLLLKELWIELERRFGNVAVITNSFLTKLKESAKFGESDKKKLQAFADLCSDVASQVNDLPGLACLNFPNAIRPILYNLPESIRNRWNKQVVTYTLKNNDVYPNFIAFASMIQQQSILKNHPNVTAVERQGRTDRGKPPIPPVDPFHTILKGDATTEEEEIKEKYCTFHKCNGHNLSECKALAKKNLDEKTRWIKEQRLCFRCLLPNHVASQCKAKVKCETCGSDRRLVLLHKERRKDKGEDDGEEVTSVRSSVGRYAGGSVSCSKIALLDVFNPDSSHDAIRVYALIDEQSNASMISPELADDLGMSGPQEKYLLSTCSGSKETRFGRRASGLMVKPLNGKPLNNIPKDKSEIPSPELARQYNHLRDIAKDIPPLDNKAEVQLLIGRNAPELLKVRAFRNGPNGTPWAHKLAVGWTICGEACINRQGGPIHISTHRTVCYDRPEECGLNGANSKTTLLQGNTKRERKSSTSTQTVYHQVAPCPNNFQLQVSFPRLQECSDVYQTTDCDNESTMSVEDRRFNTIMESGTHKNQTGHWEMPLPLRSSNTLFPDNRDHAVTRLNGLLRSLDRNPKKKEDYFNFMARLFERGHAVQIPSDQQGEVSKDISGPGNIWYLPHFGVYHPRKPNKIRVVFDSSAEFHGTSLNKELLQGPDTHNNLLGILMRFRRNSVGVVCDLEQMFHSFHVYPQHRDLLRFLWFAENDMEKEIVNYHMVVHLFGNTSSPAVATFGLRKTAEEGEKDFGQAAKDFVTKDFYVDDGLTSCPTATEAIVLVKNTQRMLATANLRLHKIASNSVEVMEALPNDDRVESLRDLDLRQGPRPSQRSLGVMWDLERDTFTFQISL